MHQYCATPLLIAAHIIRNSLFRIYFIVGKEIAAIRLAANHGIFYMRNLGSWRLAQLFMLGVGHMAAAPAADTVNVPLQRTDAGTFYVATSVAGHRADDFLVDTGSSYVAVGRSTLQRIRKTGEAVLVKHITAVMADGSETAVPVYRLSRLTIGANCVLDDIEAAVLPNQTRNILGLSALKKAAPFAISLDPPMLMLSGCITPAATGDKVASRQ